MRLPTLYHELVTWARKQRYAEINSESARQALKAARSMKPVPSCASDYAIKSLGQDAKHLGIDGRKRHSKTLKRLLKNRKAFKDCQETRA